MPLTASAGPYYPRPLSRSLEGCLSRSVQVRPLPLNALHLICRTHDGRKGFLEEYGEIVPFLQPAGKSRERRSRRSHRFSNPLPWTPRSWVSFRTQRVSSTISPANLPVTGPLIRSTAFCSAPWKLRNMNCRTRAKPVSLVLEYAKHAAE
jgi:hypothetical protein